MCKTYLHIENHHHYFFNLDKNQLDFFFRLSIRKKYIFLLHFQHQLIIILFFIKYIKLITNL